MPSIRATYVPLSDRPYVIGRSELMGYLGIDDPRKLNREFLDEGLHWDYRKGRTEYYLKASIAAWFEEHAEKWQEGTYLQERIEMKRRRSIAKANK